MKDNMITNFDINNPINSTNLLEEVIKDGARKMLQDLKIRGLNKAPLLAIGDGALGFWKALEEKFPDTKHQIFCIRCQKHSRQCKTINT